MGPYVRSGLTPTRGAFPRERLHRKLEDSLTSGRPRHEDGLLDWRSSASHHATPCRYHFSWRMEPAPSLNPNLFFNGGWCTRLRLISAINYQLEIPPEINPKVCTCIEGDSDQVAMGPSSWALIVADTVIAASLTDWLTDRYSDSGVCAPFVQNAETFTPGTNR